MFIEDNTTYPDNAFVHEANERMEIVHVYGELDCTGVREFEACIRSAARGGRSIVIDMEPCHYVDSSVLSALVKAHQEYYDRLWVIAPEAGLVRRVLDITSLSGYLQVVASSGSIAVA